MIFHPFIRFEEPKLEQNNPTAHWAALALDSLPTVESLERALSSGGGRGLSRGRDTMQFSIHTRQPHISTILFHPSSFPQPPCIGLSAVCSLATLLSRCVCALFALSDSRSS